MNEKQSMPCPACKTENAFPGYPDPLPSRPYTIDRVCAGCSATLRHFVPIFAVGPYGWEWTNLTRGDKKANEWTAKTVREELPSIPVEIYDTIYNGRIMGRVNDFAVIWPVGTDMEFQYSWATIAQVLNSGGILRPRGLG